MEHIERICSLDSKLLFILIYSIRNSSREWDIFEKPGQLSFNDYIKSASLTFDCMLEPLFHFRHLYHDTGDCGLFIWNDFMSQLYKLLKHLPKVVSNHCGVLGVADIFEHQ